MPNTQFEHIFPSGFKLSYFFSKNLSVDSDFLEGLRDFQIEGPLTEEISEKSPLYLEALVSRFLLLEALKIYKKKNIGGIAFSISHTKGAALLATAASLKFEGAKLAAGVGADLEKSERKISESAYKRITNGGFDSKVQALHLWCLKEAAYKAHPNNDNLLLSDFVVSEIKENAHFKVFCNQTSKTFEASIFNLESYVVALARLV